VNNKDKTWGKYGKLQRMNLNTIGKVVKNTGRKVESQTTSQLHQPLSPDYLE
jgi:hypothetical protein